ncbi:MAG: EthD domain-containing protein [Acidimicrobiales bacterium]
MPAPAPAGTAIASGAGGRGAGPIEGGLPMVKLTCLLKRKEGMTPVEFHTYWKDCHGPLVAGTRSGSHVTRYEQHPRPLDDYRGDNDRSGYDGVTVQWFPSMAEYRAHMEEEDFAQVMADLANFLDLDHLEFVLTERPRVIMDGRSDWD